MNLSPTVGGALLFAVSVAALPSQSPYPLAGTVLPFTPGNWTTGRSVIANISGHGLPDLVVLASQPGRSTAFVAAAPAMHCTTHVLPGTADLTIRDVAVLPNADPRSARDALALLTDGGLWFWTYGGSKQHLGNSTWNSATRIRTGLADADDTPDVVGRMGNARNLRCHPLGAGMTTWFVDTGAEVVDFLLTDWCASAGEPHDEIVVAQADRLRFVVDGHVDAARDVPLPPSSDVQLAVFDDATGDRRLVIYLTMVADGSSWLMTLSAGGGASTLQAIGTGATGITVANDANGPHVVVTWLGQVAPSTFRFLGAPAGFAANVPLPITVAAAAPGISAHWLDLDGDGDLDAIGNSGPEGNLVMQLDAEATDLVAHDPIQRTPPAWATHIEVRYFQVDIVGTGPERLALRSKSLGSQLVDATATLTYLRHGSLSTGPIATIVRYVRIEQETVTRLGGCTPYIYATADRGLDLVTAMADAMAPNSPPPTMPVELHANEALPVGSQPPAPGQVGGVVQPPKLPPPDDDETQDGSG